MVQLEESRYIELVQSEKRIATIEQEIEALIIYSLNTSISDAERLINKNSEADKGEAYILEVAKELLNLDRFPYSNETTVENDKRLVCRPGLFKRLKFVASLKKNRKSES